MAGVSDITALRGKDTKDLRKIRFQYCCYNDNMIFLYANIYRGNWFMVSRSWLIGIFKLYECIRFMYVNRYANNVDGNLFKFMNFTVFKFISRRLCFEDKAIYSHFAAFQFPVVNIEEKFFTCNLKNIKFITSSPRHIPEDIKNDTLYGGLKINFLSANYLSFNFFSSNVMKEFISGIIQS